MPIPKKKKSFTKAELFDELRHGKTYAKTSKKHGKKTAQKQMIAIALKKGRQQGFAKPKKGEAQKLHAEHKGKGRIKGISKELQGKAKSKAAKDSKVKTKDQKGSHRAKRNIGRH